MKHRFALLLLLLTSSFIWSCQPTKTFAPDEIALVPQANQMTLGQSSFAFNKNTTISIENEAQQGVAGWFAGLFAGSAGFQPEIVVGEKPSSNLVQLITDAQLGAEAYTLNVTPKTIEIKASGLPGFFYGLQTIRQLLPVAIEKKELQAGVEWLVPAVAIADAPNYRWRGFMLDVSRHFFTKAEVMQLIDYLALHKINTFHFHLVDDQGWRIEIKKYPKLTEVGAWRVNHEDKPWNARPKQQPGEKAEYGGFYTQDDIKEIVAFAESRCVTVIPEIEMPAHVSSALTAYPQFSCKGTPITVPSGGVWPITDIYCAGNDSTFAFIEDVLTEVMDLFPSKYIHVGGDEATKTEWEHCPKCKARMQQERLKNVHELQSYFIKRVEQFINAKDRVLLGWDEILEGGLPPKATVMSWRGMAGGIEASKQGHDVVMTPGTPCYFDFYQGPIDQEPLAIGGNNTLMKVYAFEPVPEELTGDEAKHILGAQANLWTEYVTTFDHVQYMAFPRIGALAEVLWSNKALRLADDFTRRMALMMQRYEAAGINYSRSGYNVSVQSVADTINRKVTVQFESELGKGKIRFTTDGSEPNASSPLFGEPVLLDQTAVVKAAVFTGNHQDGKALSREFNINKATIRPVKYANLYSPYYKGSGNYTLVNGITGTTNHGDGEWQAWNGKDMEVVIDLQQQNEISSVTVGALQNAGAWIFFPKKVEAFVSADGKQFTKVGESVTDGDPLQGGLALKQYVIQFAPVKAAFVKVVATNLGVCPKGDSGEGDAAWLFVDEIKVE